MSKVRIIEEEGKTVEEAIESALEKLFVAREDVEIEVIEEARKGVLGFGAKPARVRVSIVGEAMPLVQKPVQKLNNHDENKYKNFQENDDKDDKNEDVEIVLKKDEEEKEKFKKPLSTANQEKYIEIGSDFLKNVLKMIKIEAEVEQSIGAESARLNVKGENVGALIGKHGATLDALQYLTNIAANRDNEDRVRINVDIEGYRVRRIETLEKLAYSLANKVKRSGKKMSFEPMNSYERKIIHSALQNDKKIATFSEGDEPYRKVVVSMKK